MPGYFQFPIHYGNFDVPDQFEPDLNITWGAPVHIADMQAGLPGTRMPDGSLDPRHRVVGQRHLRGDRLPADLVGDYFYGEVVARIVRRLKPVRTEGLTQLRNAYPRSEFIRSTRPALPSRGHRRPRRTGRIYIADMYHGIIQEAQWAKQGTYLRQKIDQYQLDKIAGLGRIWRLTHDGIARDRTQPRMLQRDARAAGGPPVASERVVARHGAAAAGPAAGPIGCAGAAAHGPRRRPIRWRGIPRALDAGGTRCARRGAGATGMEDADPRMRIQAIRASETLYKAGDRSFAADYRAMTKDADTDVVVQAMLTLKPVQAG